MILLPIGHRAPVIGIGGRMARHSLNFLLVCLVVAMVAAAGPARAQTTSPTVTADPKAPFDVDVQLVLAAYVSARIDAV